MTTSHIRIQAQRIVKVGYRSWRQYGKAPCPRCLRTHRVVTLRWMRNPIKDSEGTWKWYWICPRTGDPVITIAPRGYHGPRFKGQTLGAHRGPPA